jgi:uncharacterized protein (TIRG00374 family)
LAIPAKYVRQFLVITLLSVVFYGVSAAWSGVGEVWSSLGRIGWTGWAIILGLSLFNYTLRFVRWDYYLRKLEYSVPVSGNLAAYLAGFAFTTTPAKVGEALRSFYLKPLKVTYVHSLSALFVERLVDLIAMILVASLAAYAFEDMRWIVAVALLGAIAIVPVMHSPAVQSWLERLRERVAAGRLAELLGYLVSMLRTSSTLLRSGPLYYGLLLGLIAWGAEGYAFYVVLDRLGADTSLWYAAGVYGIGILAGAVSFVPGGLGSTELAMGTLLILNGVAVPTAVAAVIICRLATLWFAVLIGLAVVLKLEFGSSGDGLASEI